MAAPVRQFGFPDGVEEPIFLFNTDSELKEHASYRKAKAGDWKAAVNVVVELCMPVTTMALNLVPDFENAIFLAPHAHEASGDNAIPQVLATMLSVFGGEVDTEIVQSSRVFHTGADAMQRMISRASFEGEVVPGGKYVLVDDVTTLGGTLADLSDFIQRSQGSVIAVIVIVNASRSGRLKPSRALARKLYAKGYENEIREIFGIEQHALTAEETQYLLGFRNADEIRNRATSAREERTLRLRSKGIEIDSGA